MLTTIVSPCGILGYGFPEDSLKKAMSYQPDAIIVDAGSTDAGPHKLGAGVAIVSRQATKIDLSRLMSAAKEANIPLIVGSCGGSGAEKHTRWTLDIVEEIAREMAWPAKIAVIFSDISKEEVSQACDAGRIEKMSPNVPDLTHKALEETNGIVAQMGVEPILEALKADPDIILCGRAYDPAPFAAFGIMRGHDPALCQHMGKILECGALCAEPGTAKDVILGQLDETGFEVWPANEARQCNITSVAAHTFYEKSHPTVLKGPGIQLNLSACRFSQAAPGRVRVEGSRMSDVPYTLKLEGARLSAYRTFVLSGIRDPLLISIIDQVEEEVVKSVDDYYGGLADDIHINFYHYGKDAVMGRLEPSPTVGHEIGLMFEVIAPTQETANAVCASVRSTYLHHGYPGRKSTAGNLAFPFAPSDISFGPVYEFSVYHLMRVDDPCEHFPVMFQEVKI